MGRRSAAYAAVLVVILLIAAPQLRALDLGEGQVLLLADEVTYDSKTHVVTATGHVEVTRGERRLLADVLRYHQDTDRMEAEGNVALVDPSGDTLFADRVVLSGDLKEGVGEQLRARMTDDSLLAAAGGRRTGGVRTDFERAVYSPCPLCPNSDAPPLWQLTAREAIHDQQTHDITYRDAFFELYGVPILYTPYFTQPDPTVKRRSGFLAPTFGHDSALGFSVQPIYFYAPAPNYDVTLSPLFYTQENPLLAVEYRHLLESGHFQFNGSGTYASKPIKQQGEPQPSGDTFRGAIEGHGRFALPRDWQSGFDLQAASDDTYLERYGFSNENVLNSRLFAERFWERDFVTLNAYGFQGLREQDKQGLIPIALPWAHLRTVSDPWLWGSRFSIDTDALALTRTDGLDTRRLSATPAWQLPWYSPIGDRYELILDVRGDFYQTDGDPQTYEENGSNVIGRVVPRATLHWGWPWIGEIFGTSQVLEPVAMATVASAGRNSGDIPNEDSLDFEFDDTSLFEPSRFPGLDRVQGGPSLAYGLRFGTFTGRPLISGMFGQAYSFEQEAQFEPETGLSEKFSDYVGRVDLSPGDWLDLRYRFTLDNDNLTYTRNEVGMAVNLPRAHFDLGYLMLASDPAVQSKTEREEIRGGVFLRLSDWLSLRGTARYDLTADRPVSWQFGTVYTHPCLQLLLGVERRNTNNRDAENATSVSLRVVLKNLGEFGTQTNLFGG